MLDQNTCCTVCAFIYLKFPRILRTVSAKFRMTGQQVITHRIIQDLPLFRVFSYHDRSTCWLPTILRKLLLNPYAPEYLGTEMTLSYLAARVTHLFR
jgi:hypothetical protein